MNSDRLNKWLTLAAHLGVLIGIALLLVELNQNHEIIRGQTRTEITHSVVAVMNMTATNKELAEIIARANKGEELTPAESLILSTRNQALFRMWENAHYQYRQGLYDEEEFSSQLRTWRDLLSSLSAHSHMVRFWCNNRNHFSTSFMDEIDGLLAERGCGPVNPMQ